MDSPPASISPLSTSDSVSINKPEPYTSTPTKLEFSDSSMGLSLFNQIIDTSTSENMLESSQSSENSSDTEITINNSMTLEEFKILPSRVWKDK